MDQNRTQQGATQPTGPQRGDQYYDPKRKRQYVYEGPDEVFEGKHSFISDQGKTFVGDLSDLEKFTDESKFLNIDDLSEYRSAIDDLDTFLGDIRHGSKSMEDGFWDRAQKAVRRVNKAEGKVKKKIKHHRMETDSYKKKKVLQGYIDSWKNKHNNTNINTNKNQNENTNRNTNANIEDLDPETLANLTDEEIIEWANSADDYDRAINLREEARNATNLKNDQIEPIEWDVNASDSPIEREDTYTHKKVQELTQQEKERFNRQQEKEFNQRMKEIENKYGDKPKRKTKGKKKKASAKSFDLDAQPIKTRKMGNFKKVVSSAIVNEAIETAEETIEEAVETTAKSIAKNQSYNVVNMKHPSQMTDSELANLSDEEFEQLKSLANGNKKDLNNWEERRNKGKAEKIYNDFVNGESNYYHSNVENTHPYKYERPETDFEVDENGNVKIEKGTGNRTIEVEDNKTSRRSALDDINVKRSANTKSMDDVFDWMKKHKIGMLDIGINLFTSIGDYKNARRQGHGVLSSTARAAASFAMGEMLGFWGSVGVGVFKGVGTMAVKGTELLYKENRKMNSAANKQVFGTAEFYDTQQLATMRQSGMEMAKMAQYNLQQTLMGNEATYLHR